MSKVLRIGTRGSALALWQANETKRLIEGLPDAPAVELVIIKTQGDLQQDVPLWKTPGKGFFTAELDRAQLAELGYMHPGRVDVIAAGSLVLSRIMELTGAKEFVASESDILDGMAWSLAR